MLFPISITASAKSFQEMAESYFEFERLKTGGEIVLPFSLESKTSSVNSYTSVRYVLKDVSFDAYVRELGSPAQWCEFIPLHLNIKACGHFFQGGQPKLQFYAGVKGYLSPDSAHLLQLDFETNLVDDVFHVRLFAVDGPLDSSNIDFNIYAIGIEDNSAPAIYLEFDLSSVPGLAANLAKIYLATVASKKIGFSVIGETWTGKPKYVKGQRGAAERNIVRYLLAIETFFSTLEVVSEDRLLRRLETWFDATESYSAQLYEIGREEYMENKQRERQNQVILQSALDQGVEPIYNVPGRRR